MPLALVTTSHSPLLGINPPPADVERAVEDAFAETRRFIGEFDPELVVIFAPDHYNGVFYDLLPPFCLGMAASSIGDYTTRTGPLDVDREAAALVVEHVLAADVDLAISERLEVDHGFAQPLEILFGAVAAVPTVPIFINSVAVPLAPVRRVRRLGHAVGSALAGLGKRVLVLGSGGLSHDPPVPRLAGATAQEAERLIAGRQPSPDERTAREVRVLRAGRAMATGTDDLQPLNPDWDHLVMRTLAAADFDTVDGWSTDWFAKEAGNSAHEVRTWIAAYAALAADGPYRVSQSFYRPIPEWIAGFGITTAGSSTVHGVEER
ncbi:3-carboxyethylcatechol 2,3-dioxygenase [Streptomyces sp. NPDC047043]|uniref:3-carboxyethylcatechol 2,3-dioxygenase n=1 Tax=Streptomyces sp. NPDC047043 TaxID=3154497 RepID=UPI0033E0A3B0